MNDELQINEVLETKKIVEFIKTTLKDQGFTKVVIGISGGIDSSLSLALLAKSINTEDIIPVHLYYFESQLESLNALFENINIPKKNILNISIKSSVDEFKKTLNLKEMSDKYKERLGNIMARVRMTILYDLAKKYNALVCGTENKSEFYLGYFTRFGDEASDFEPIQHLYKTQVIQLSKYLKLPKNIIDQAPTAGLWKGQTDEGEFGFTYKEADIVLKLYFEKKNTVPQIIEEGFLNADKIIKRAKKNSFKHHLPYKI